MLPKVQKTGTIVLKGWWTEWYSDHSVEAFGGLLQLSGHTVLCVDDEVVGLQVRKLILERSGYTVLTALDGPTGIEIFHNEEIDAVVLDYSMPGMHGGEVAARMRELKPNVPILLLSAYMGLPSEVTRLVNVYMTKGEGAPVLLQKLAKLVEI